MKVAVILGNVREKSNSAYFVKKLEKCINEIGKVDFEYIFLKDKSIKGCLGCQACYGKGEKCCPLKDDMADIKESLKSCDGFIMVSPTYVMNVTYIMKNFIDRLSYMCHRPEFFGKKVFLLSTAGRMGAGTTLKLMSYPVIAWGCTLSGKLGINMYDYNNSIKYKDRIEGEIRKDAQKFYSELREKDLPQPGVFNLIGFQMKKKRYAENDLQSTYDGQYWTEKGWLERDNRYYYNTRIGFLNKFLASIFIKIMIPFLKI